MHLFKSSSSCICYCISRTSSSYYLELQVLIGTTSSNLTIIIGIASSDLIIGSEMTTSSSNLSLCIAKLQVAKLILKNLYIIVNIDIIIYVKEITI